MLTESFRPDGTLVNVGLTNSRRDWAADHDTAAHVQQMAAIAAISALAITAH